MHYLKRLRHIVIYWLSKGDDTVLLWVIRHGTINRPKPEDTDKQIPASARERFFEELRKKRG